jgi:iron complex outermembrane receptor protein
VPGVFAGTTGTVRFKQNLDGGWLWTTQLGGQRLSTDDRLGFAFGCGGDYCDRFYGNNTAGLEDGSFDLYDWRSNNERRNSVAIQTTLDGTLSTGFLRHHLSTTLSRYRQTLKSEDLQTNIYKGTGNIYNSAVVPSELDYSEPGNNRSEYTTEISFKDRIALTEQTQLWLGLRHTRMNRSSERTDGSRAVQDVRSFNTPWLALTHQITPAYLVYGSYGEGVETDVAPNRSRYTNAGEVLPALRSQQVELGVKGQWQRSHWQASVFDITRPQSGDAGDCDADNSCTRKMDGDARHRGLELAAGTTQGAWSLQGSAAWIDAQRQNAVIDLSTNGQRALNVPRMTLRALAQYRFADVPGLRTSLRLNHEGARRVTEDGNIQMPCWTTLDLATHYDTRIQGTRTQWTLAIDNLADRRYWRESPKQYGHYYLYPGAHRTLRLGIKASF